MSFKHIVLGTLMDLPTYGYDIIKKCFMDFTPADPKINEGRLYSSLKVMERDGMVEREVKLQDDLPAQKIISITPAGVEEFYHWLASNADEEGHVKFDFFKQYPFLTKVNFFSYMTPEQKALKLEEQLDICRRRLQRFHQAKVEMEEKKVDHYRIKILEYGIEVELLKMEWLQDLLQETGSRSGQE